MTYKNLSLFLFAVVVASCSPSVNRHLKQAERHLRKAEIDGAKVRVDTIFKTISVIVPETRIDTVLTHVDFRDTIVVQKDKIVTKIKYDTATRRLYVHTISPSDTVRIEVPVQVVKEIKSGFPWIWVFITFIFGAVVSAIFLRRS